MTLLQRPIFGGVFGAGQYALASMLCVSNGLYSIRYFVLDARAGSVVSIGESKGGVLASARDLLRAVGALNLDAANDASWSQGELFSGLLVPDQEEDAPRVSRRRRAIFERSKGQCAYCATPLTLDVEHQLPRALGGADDSINLVAACAPCNLRKGAKSAIEFLALDVE